MRRYQGGDPAQAQKRHQELERVHVVLPRSELVPRLIGRRDWREAFRELLKDKGVAFQRGGGLPVEPWTGVVEGDRVVFMGWRV